ncbi:MAG: PEP/pyruvate-binding domain-containing protein [Chloroflexi bacterium]|nr:PEP/pyruvate-binding domain-containing protein [Chloroflexota bacterium]
MDVLWLEDPAARDPLLVGGKVANLARLAGSFPVPAGFGIPCDEIIGPSSAQTAAGYGAATGVALPVPPDLAIKIESAYSELGQRCGSADLAVAVRSSAAEEDGHTASFAGQLASYRNISGRQAVVDAVVRCRESANGARVRSYGQAKGFGPRPRLGVFVQQFVPADASAVVFSANPITGDHDEVLINANYGLGESIVSGIATPDTFVVRKSDLAILAREVGAKERMTVPVPGGTRELIVPAGRKATLAISDDQARGIARLAIELERFFGWPADTECAYLGPQLYVLQCRPITTLG